MTRLFVAIWPPDDVLERLADVERPKDQGVKWVPPENLHITLRFLGDADVDEVTARLDDVNAARCDRRRGACVRPAR
jgi:RNA 2',3'-cyclic 3'-phosphodiesterase